ncbi:hypothetical protein D3C80_1663940 [compost metagenome]
MHIHDTDIIHWLFGKPERVSTLGRNVVSINNGYDAVSAHYYYADGKVLNAQADWSLEGEHGFEMTFRVNFEKGNLVFKNDQLKVNPKDEAGFIADLSGDTGYYRELEYFTQAVLDDRAIEVCTPESTLGTLEIIEAEMQSADQGGLWVESK